MVELELKILALRQKLTDVYAYALAKSPVSMSVVRQLKLDLALCEKILLSIRSRHKIKSG